MTPSTFRRRHAALAGAAIALTGCTSLPAFEHLQPAAATAPPSSAPDIAWLVRHIECELVQVMLDASQASEGSPLKQLFKRKYVAFANLAADVTIRQGVAPSLSFIHPFAISGTRRSAILGADFSGDQHRNITQTFALELDPTRPASLPKATEGGTGSGACQQPGTSGGLRGRLGLTEIFVAGLSQTRDNFLFRQPTLEEFDDLGDHVSPVFGTTIDFTIVYGASGGPQWNVVNFEGPGGALLGVSRTVKDSLTISFAAVDESSQQARASAESKSQAQAAGRGGEAGPRATAVRAALRAAQENVSRMILQRLVPTF